MYKVEWVDSVADIPAQLWEACFPFPYEGRWWYEALEQAGLQDQFIFKYGVVSENGQLLAIAPAFVMNVPIELVIPPALLPIFKLAGKLFPSLLYQRTFFIGSPCSDEGRVGAVKDANMSLILAAIHQSMLEQAEQLGATMRVWKDFANEHQQAFVKLMEKGLFHLVSFPGTSLPLAGNTKDDYIASIKSSRRNKLKKKLKQAHDAPVYVEILHRPNDQVLQEIFGLF